MLIHRRDLLKTAASLAGAIVLPGGTSVAWPAVAPGNTTNGTTGQQKSRPWVYWYWMNANISRDGIVADLTAMQTAGIEGIFLFNIGGADTTTLIDPPVQSQTPAWWELVRFAVSHAAELGMSVAMNVCDGWGTAGGAWITPEQSAQELVWTETLMAPGLVTHTLPQPTTRLGYYRDVAAFAFPVPVDWLATQTHPTSVSASWPIDNVARVGDAAQSTVVIATEERGWLQYFFEQPFTLRSVTVRTPSVPILPFLSVGYNGAANSLAIEASDDGSTFRPFFKLRPPQLGWQSNLHELTHSIPPTRARHFRFVHDPQMVELVSGDGRFNVTRRLSLASLSLSSRAVVNHLQVKSGLAWGLSSPMNEALLPTRDCVPAESLVDVSDKLAADGTLHWRAPEGTWSVLRIGHTSNGVVTSPSGKAGGLECDKFDAAVIERQFDGWFGEALRQVGPELAGKVLHTLHIDSWEGRSQNWSPVFAREFKARRGYDLRPLLVAMTGVPLGSANHTERFLFDVRRTIADLLRDTCFGTLERLAHRNGCLFSAQQTNATFPSDGMQHFRHVDLPCGEFWKGRPASDKPSDVREAVSGARLYGKSIVTAEAFTGQLDWSEHPFSFKAQGDQQFCLGINRFILHVWAHQALANRQPGITMFGYGSFFSETQPWWPMAGAWLDYLSRCQSLLQEGKPVVDVCYYTGEDIPSRAFLPSALTPSLPRGYSYDSINPDALLTLATVSEGRIVLPGGASYAVLILPHAMPVTLRVASKLRDLIRAGANIVGTRPLPSPSLEDDDAAVAAARATVETMWTHASDPLPRSESRRAAIDTEDFPGVLASLVPPDVVVEGSDEVLWTHRRDERRDLYFFSNQSNAAGHFKVSLRSMRSNVALYDPLRDEQLAALALERRGDRLEFRLPLDASGSMFVLCEDQPPQRATPAPSRKLPESVLIQPPWTVDFDDTAGARSIAMERLISWPEHDDPAIRYFSGTARYSTTFNWHARRGFRWHLDPGEFANVIQVFLNGRNLGVLWAPGTHVDATAALRRGRNELEIVVANTWRNRLVGDRDLPAAKRTTWLMPNRLGPGPAVAFDPALSLLPAGLLGPVKIVPL